MQALDIHYLDVDIAHAGLDQRKIHMLVRELFPKMKWKVPVIVHHNLLPGLSKPESTDSKGSKMSKSDPSSGIFIHDSNEQIQSKIKRAWCEEGNIQNNPLLDICKHIIFHEFNSVIIERPQRFGGNITYHSYDEIESDFAARKLHPVDLKAGVSKYLIKIIEPIRNKISLDSELIEAIKRSV